MNRIFLAFFALLLAMLACSPNVTTKDATATVTTFVDENGSGQIPESYTPLPDTLVIATWNVHGGMYREVKLTDQNGRAGFSVGYTHFFDISVFPPCEYYSTTPLHRDMTDTEKAEFGFWPADPTGQSSTVKVLVWKDLNANGVRDPQEEVTGEKVSAMFKIPGGVSGNLYDEDNFDQGKESGDDFGAEDVSVLAAESQAFDMFRPSSVNVMFMDNSPDWSSDNEGEIIAV